MRVGATAILAPGMFSFSVLARSGTARAGLLATPHGRVETPAFMPVGTAGAVKALTRAQLEETGAQVLLANTYHLMLRPGDALVAELGGLHGFTGWPGPFLTDSGGYQVFSLAALRRIDEDGVSFQSHLDGSAHRRSDQWLFGIVQGGVHLDLREKSAADVVALGFPGHAIGGLAVGETKDDTWKVVDHVAPLLPEDKPRYLMGVGTPEDLLDGVARGIDLFDCVLPTRNARNGQLFTRRGRLSIRNARHRADPRPPDPECACYTCRTASRAYLRHLHLAKEMTAATLMTLHNLSFYLDTLRRVRQNILLGRFEEFRSELLRALAASEAEAEGGA